MNKASAVTSASHSWETWRRLRRVPRAACSWCVRTQGCGQCSGTGTEMGTETAVNPLIQQSCESHFSGGVKSIFIQKAASMHLGPAAAMGADHILKIESHGKWAFFWMGKFIDREKSNAAFAPAALDLERLFCGQSRKKFGSSLSARVSEHSDCRLPLASDCPQHDLRRTRCPANWPRTSFQYLLKHSQGSLTARPVRKLPYRLHKSEKNSGFADRNASWISKSKSWVSSRSCSGCYSPGPLLSSAS